jgi:segregation and condensation protein A
VIQIAFPGFSGTPEALREALRRGRISPRAVPVLKVIEDALAQLPPSLKERSEVLPILAELLVLKLAPERAMEAEEGKEAPLVQALLDLSETVAFLEARLKARARLLPVGPTPPPQARPPAFPQDPLAGGQALPPGGSGPSPGDLWAEGGLGAASGASSGEGGLPGPAPWGAGGERAVAFAALLEAHRLGLLRLHQEAPFAPLHVEVLQERQELSA